MPIPRLRRRLIRTPSQRRLVNPFPLHLADGSARREPAWVASPAPALRTICETESAITSAKAMGAPAPPLGAWAAPPALPELCMALFLPLLKGALRRLAARSIPPSCPADLRTR